MIDELVIKVPAPFSGIEDLGFTARYPAQDWPDRQRDVPVIVEGPAKPMARLVDRLSLFTEKERLFGREAGDDEAYTWTAPIQLTDEVCLLAFRDQSLSDGIPSDAVAARGVLWNLVRPLAFTFLRDCVRIGGLRLSERIAVVLDSGTATIVDLEMERSAISAQNGTLLLFGA